MCDIKVVGNWRKGRILSRYLRMDLDIYSLFESFLFVLRSLFMQVIF